METVNNKQRKLNVIIAVLLILMPIISGCGQNSLDDQISLVAKETAATVTDDVESPATASVGGEWGLLGVIRSGADLPNGYEQMYYDSIRAAVKGSNGVLSERKYTEYERAVIGLTAIGADPHDVEGYDLTEPIGDYEKVVYQGANAVAFALISLNMAGVHPEAEQMYVSYLVDKINSDELNKDKFAADYIAMAVQGLSFYTYDPDVKVAINHALQEMSEMQENDGSFGNCESTVEVIIALCQLNEDIFETKDFIKNGKTLWDGLMQFRLKDSRFRHTLENDNPDLMSTEKALLAISAVKLQREGRTLYPEKEDEGK